MSGHRSPLDKEIEDFIRTVKAAPERADFEATSDSVLQAVGTLEGKIMQAVVAMMTWRAEADKTLEARNAALADFREKSAQSEDIVVRAEDFQKIMSSVSEDVRKLVDMGLEASELIKQDAAVTSSVALWRDVLKAFQQKYKNEYIPDADDFERDMLERRVRQIEYCLGRIDGVEGNLERFYKLLHNEKGGIFDLQEKFEAMLEVNMQILHSVGAEAMQDASEAVRGLSSQGTAGPVKKQKTIRFE